MDFTRGKLASVIVAAVLFLAATASPLTASALTLTHTLTWGATGSDVSAVQQFLQRRGYYSYSSITGYYGSHTWQAVAAFQDDFHLDPVGYTGPKTRALIAELTASTTAPNPVTLLASTSVAMDTAPTPAASSTPLASTASTTGSTTSLFAAITASTSQIYRPFVMPLPGYSPRQIIFIGGGSAMPFTELRTHCRVRAATLYERLAALTAAGQIAKTDQGYRLAGN
jgi:peptidoglycan hydrolase-like protein with peptidoglycan-binding domain